MQRVVIKLAYISIATANKYISDEAWNELADGEKEKHIESASSRLDRVSFRTDNASTSYPRFNANNSNPAKGKLSLVVSCLALAYMKNQVRAEGIKAEDLPIREKVIEIASLRESTKDSFSSIVLDLPDAPLHVQSLLAEYASHVHPAFRVNTARPINYIFEDGDD